MTSKFTDIDELSIEEVYAEIRNEYGHATFEREDGTISVDLGYPFDESLADIEKFVEKIAFSKSIKTPSKMELLTYAILASSLVNMYRDNYFYSPRVTIFFEAAKKVFGSGHYDPKLFESLVAEIKEISMGKVFKDKLRKWKENFRRSHLSAKKYVDALFEKYSRLLVIRIDLGFVKEKYVEKISLNDAKDYFSKFLNARRNNKIFSDVVGYVWKMECGDVKGYHYHLLIFMDGSKVQKDEYRAILMGQYWRHITGGKGAVFISNLIKKKFSKIGRLGIGMISHFDHEKRKNLDFVLQYFFKIEQCLKEKSLQGTRTYDRGEMPSISKTSFGRPRQIRDNI